MKKYVLVTWPESQELETRKGFEKHCSLADSDKFGPGAYFVEENWLNKEYELNDYEEDDYEQ